MTAEERLAHLQAELLEEYDWELDLTQVQLQGPSTTFRPECPECGGGSTRENCFAVTVYADNAGKPESVAWHCHRATCGFEGGLSIYKASSRARQAIDRAAAQRAPWLPPSAYPPAQQQHQQSQQQQAAPQAQRPFQPFQPPAAAAGQLAATTQPLQQAPVTVPPAATMGNNLRQLTPELVQWFADRGISQATLESNRVMMENRYNSSVGGRADHIAFPYFKDGVMVNIKYRALPKAFSQVKGGQQTFYGYDAARGANEIIIVEGEMDKLAVEQALYHQAAAAAAHGSDAGDTAAAAAVAGQEPTDAADVQLLSPAGGRRAVVSVPAGAPARAVGQVTSTERKFKFLEDCHDLLQNASRVVLAVDNDQPGVVLAGELARRIGREKCLVVTWPSSQATSKAPTAEAADAEAASDASLWARKDANEVLAKDGPGVLCRYINDAKPLPIRGLHGFDEFWPQVYDMWAQGSLGLGCVSTGWDDVDEFYRVVPGELTIVTGLPNNGKSEWLDALLVNLAMREGWTFAVCSLENTPTEHGRKLMEKYTGKAFLEAPYAHGTSKLTYWEVVHAIEWADEHFHLIRPQREEMPTIDWILDKAKAAVLRYGIRGLIIDPYNELNAQRSKSMSETEYVSRTLTKIKRFAQHYECHVWFVAHPRTQRGTGVGGGSGSLSAPTMYDISGSAHFINKADNGLVIHRPYMGVAAAAEGKDTSITQVLVRKVRNKVAGRIGDVKLSYDRASGRFLDVVPA